MSKKKDVAPEKTLEQIWVYPGERRPVVVEAKNERHGMDKVRRSPQYDGFPPKIYPLLKFITMCAPKEAVPVPAETAEDKRHDDSHIFIMVKVVAGKVTAVKVYSDEAASKLDANKIAEHLDPEKDQLIVFSLENHVEIAENEFLEAKQIHVGKKESKEVKEVKEVKAE